jgi:hypothetical protein
MAQREQLTLCSTQVNSASENTTLKNLFARELTSKKLILEETRELGLFQDKCLYFKINIVKQL